MTLKEKSQTTMNINEQLNSLPSYIDKECIYCKRKYPNTILNIEGRIHYNEPFRCLDTKSCNKAKKKLKK